MRNNEIQKTRETRRVVSKLLLAGMMCYSFVMAHAQTFQINVNDAQFTRQFVERLIAEYGKINPQFSATVVKTREQADATVSISEQTASVNSIGRFAIVPIANSENEILRNKKLAKGLDNKLKHQIFVERDITDDIDDGFEEKKKLPGTVYSLTGRQSITTAIVAKELSVTPNRVKGKKIVGSEESLISAVKSHSDAIAFNVASLVYDANTHKPVVGLTVLPTDLDGNGKVDEAERSAIASLDNLTAYLEKIPHTSLPTGSININTDNSELLKFAAWASTEGQNFIAQYGFLKADKPLTAQK